MDVYLKELDAAGVPFSIKNVNEFGALLDLACQLKNKSSIQIASRSIEAKMASFVSSLSDASIASVHLPASDTQCRPINNATKIEFYWRESSSDYIKRGCKYFLKASLHDCSRGVEKDLKSLRRRAVIGDREHELVRVV